jgi:hypothetical protein
MASATPPASFLRTLCWAVYLGCSWTWCIGMFMPVILVSEFGLGAWFVFAIPNVIGAAAMGWTLARPGSSERLVTEHRTACVAFSAVTLAFHLFFLYWLSFIGLMPVIFSVTAVVAGLSFGLVGRRRVGLDFVLAWLVLAVSLTVMGKGLMHPVFGVEHPIEIDRVGMSMVGLAPVCIFGFLLCPYLDVTFHRARQEMPPFAGKLAFGIGFGVVFLSMLVLTLLYTGDFALDQTPLDRFGSYGGSLLISWVAFHLAAQAGLKFALHLRAIPSVRPVAVSLWIGAAVLVGLAIFTIRQQMWFAFPALSIQMLSAQLVYRLFMSFYGLIFPTYVWICMVPIRGFAPGPSRRAMVVLAGAVLLASPLYWVGFVNERMLWLIPAMAIVLLARLFAGKAKRSI